MKICIDAGHTGTNPDCDPGATGTRGTAESDINLRIAQILRTKLQQRQAIAIMTRNQYNAPEIDDLARRAAICNNAGCECFVSIHCNAAVTTSASGFEVYFYNGSARGNLLANKIINRLQQQTLLLNRGVKGSNFQVLRETNCPAVLVECGFLTNPQDERYLLGIIGQATIAQAIADALLLPT